MLLHTAARPDSPDPPAPVAHDAVPSLAHMLQGAPDESPLVPGQPEFNLHEPATAIDPKDKGTPDDWVPRDPRLVRLTGRHPLNCEPPMRTLMEHGFITPESLMYVRNHGKVPQLDWRMHRIKVHGLVNTPLELSMDELLDMPSVTLPVTTVCSGNRRKEVNMIKKSKGYNWGACAVATSYWTGVRLRDLLLKAGAKVRVAWAGLLWSGSLGLKSTFDLMNAPDVMCGRGSSVAVMCLCAGAYQRSLCMLDATAATTVSKHAC